MGLFDFFKNLFAPSLDAKLDKISRRVNELRRQVPTNPPKTTSIDLTIFDIDTKSTSKEPNIFEPRQFEISTTMRSLKEKRIELELKRIEDLRKQVILNLQTVGTLIIQNYLILTQISLHKLLSKKRNYVRKRLSVNAYKEKKKKKHDG